tara:strand:+ start:51 stop:629 length:579 start_codon:yes stop_codon:yes gene_type:complete
MLSLKDTLIGFNELPKTKGNQNSKSFQSLFDFTSKLSPSKILEVGFNAGDSACCFLNASPKASMITFDVCKNGHEYTALTVLQKYFDIELIEGDSKLTLPNWLRLNKDIYFDLIYIDGGHDYDTALSDINNLVEFVRPGGYILVDDINIFPSVRQAIDDSNLGNFKLSELVNSNGRILVAEYIEHAYIKKLI